MVSTSSAVGNFGNYKYHMRYFIERSGGSFANVTRVLPFKGIPGWVMRIIGMTFIVHKKVK